MVGAPLTELLTANDPSREEANEERRRKVLQGRVLVRGEVASFELQNRPTSLRRRSEELRLAAAVVLIHWKRFEPAKKTRSECRCKCRAL